MSWERNYGFQQSQWAPPSTEDIVRDRIADERRKAIDRIIASLTPVITAIRTAKEGGDISEAEAAELLAWPADMAADLEYMRDEE